MNVTPCSYSIILQINNSQNDPFIHHFMEKFDRSFNSPVTSTINSMKNFHSVFDKEFLGYGGNLFVGINIKL